jgi:hypothetical protein
VNTYAFEKGKYTYPLPLPHSLSALPSPFVFNRTEISRRKNPLRQKAQAKLKAAAGKSCVHVPPRSFDTELIPVLNHQRTRVQRVNRLPMLPDEPSRCPTNTSRPTRSCSCKTCPRAQQRRICKTSSSSESDLVSLLQDSFPLTHINHAATVPPDTPTSSKSVLSLPSETLLSWNTPMRPVRRWPRMLCTISRSTARPR